MSVLKRAISLFTGNNLCQSLLEYNVRFSHYLMGVGAGTKVYSSGETAVVELINSMQGSSICVFDVGANVGQFSHLIRQHCDLPRIRMHCFEPSAEAFEKLTRQNSDCPQITLNRCALGATRGTATLYSDQPASGLSSLTRRDLEHVGKSMTLSQTVAVRTVDDYCAEHAIDHIHLLKIDVEGHERDVLAGAARMFAEKRIDSVTFEFGGCNIDSRTFFRDFYHFFRDQNMQVYRMTPRGFLRLIGSYRETHEQFLTTNFMAVRKSAA